MTREIFREDAYARTCTATVTAVNGNQVELDQTVFYPLGGGQPGDTGRLTLAGGGSPRVTLEVTDTRKGDSPGSIVHICKDPVPPGLSGSQVEAEIHWERRYRLMRMHTCLHLLCAVVPAAVTGGAVRDGSGRLDFDWPESTLDKAHVSAELQRLVAENHPVAPRWVSDAELEARPELVRTMSVRPPQGQGKVRLLDIQGVDLQPCGGTHVSATGEVGQVTVTKIEKKGKHNRRVNLVLG